MKSCNHLSRSIVIVVAYIMARLSGSSKLTFVQEYADLLLRIHGLHKKWRFAFDQAKTRYGCCHHSLYLITISRHLVQNEKTPMRVIKNIILHEIAHALVGHEVGHGEKWINKAKEIGCDGKRTCSFDVEMPGQKHIRCPCGANKLERFRITKRIKNAVCKFCRSPLYVVNEQNDIKNVATKNP